MRKPCWLMAELIPLRELVSGSRFEVWCVSTTRAAEWAGQIMDQFDEQVWLVTRLREASNVWRQLLGDSVVILIREVFGVSASDEEIVSSIKNMPNWVLEVKNSNK